MERLSYRRYTKDCKAEVNKYGSFYGKTEMTLS